MSAIPKKIVVDKKGAPVEVILPWPVFCEMAEMLGLGLDAEAEADLRETRRDLEVESTNAFFEFTLALIAQLVLHRRAAPADARCLGRGPGRHRGLMAQR